MLKIKFKKQYFHLIAVILFVISIGLFVFSPSSFLNIARALSGDYTKTDGAGANPSLTHTDWNNLPNEFLDKSGDTMSGDLNMSNNAITNLANPVSDDQAVSRGAMNTAIASFVAAAPIPTLVDTSGAALKVVCGRSTPADWVTYGTTNETVYVDVDMSAAAFATNPNIVTSIYGVQQHWKTYGATSIYDLTPTSFRVYVFSLGLPVNAATAQSWGWGINWCGYGG